MTACAHTVWEYTDRERDGTLVLLERTCFFCGSTSLELTEWRCR